MTTPPSSSVASLAPQASPPPHPPAPPASKARTNVAVPSILEWEDFKSPVARASSHIASPLATPARKSQPSSSSSNNNNTNMTATSPPSPSNQQPAAMPLSCNFEALSRHFHLPLKVAAEKFGVRATAFKKRCRAIGIRHWPYRKVRSLKRSLQELGKCKEEGTLTEKQQRQLTNYQNQMNRLLSPELYGIDPNGCIGLTFADSPFEDDHENEAYGDDDDDNDSCMSPSHSPRVSVSIATRRKTKAVKKLFQDSPASAAAGGSFATARFFRNGMMKKNEPYEELDLPSVRLTGGIDSNCYLAFDAYEPCFQDFSTKNDLTLTIEDFERGHSEDDRPSSGYSLDATATTYPHDDFFPWLRSPTMANSRGLTLNASTGASEAAEAIADESFAEEDDIFLQISPEYGCLV